MIDAIKCLAVINEAYVDFFSVFQSPLHYPYITSPNKTHPQKKITTYSP